MIEVSLPILISVLALLATVYFNTISKNRLDQNEATKNGSELTTVIVKLESISGGVSEIKSDLRNMKTEIQENRERIIRVEDLARQLRNELDSLRINKLKEKKQEDVL